MRDEKGRPIKGLRKEDFSVQLGMSEWPIYSVDDFCRCDGSPSSRSDAAPAETAAGDDDKSAAAPALPAAGEGTVRYVITERRRRNKTIFSRTRL